MKGETRTTTANTVLPKAGLNSFDWTFVQGSTVVILLNFCASISPPSAIPKTLAAILQPTVLNRKFIYLQTQKIK